MAAGPSRARPCRMASPPSRLTPIRLYDWFDAQITSTGGQGVKAIGFCAAFRNDVVGTRRAGQVHPVRCHHRHHCPAGPGRRQQPGIRLHRLPGPHRHDHHPRPGRPSQHAPGGGYVSIDDLAFVMQPTVTLSVNPSTIAENGGHGHGHGHLVEHHHPDTVTVNLGYTGQATQGTDYSAANSITVTAGNADRHDQHHRHPGHRLRGQ